MVENLAGEQITVRLDMAERKHAESTSVADMRLWAGIIEKLIDEQTRREFAATNGDRK